MPHLTLSALLSALLVLSVTAVSGQKAKPNIILLYADDLGYTDLSCQGSDYYRTPNIDRLAKEGMTFTNAYAAAANCAPSRASLMTGLYTPRHGVFTVGNSNRGKAAHRRLIPISNKIELTRKLPTMAQVLKGAGYRTAVAGKWHLSDDPTAYGFESNFGGLTWGAPKSYFSPYRNPKLKDGPRGEHLPARLATDLCNWIRSTQKKKDGPFFVYFPFYSVHTPIQARADLTAKYAGKSGTHHRNAKYAAMIEAMDLAVGRILDLLDELELAKDTLVVFTSDNGPHGAVSNAKPLRGSKGMFYEGGIREPFLVRWPGRIRAASRLDTAIHQVDLLPTFAAVAGTEAPELQDGLDLSPLFRGDSLPDRPLFWHFPAYLQGYGKDLGSPFQHFRTTPCGVVRQGSWKLIEYFEDGTLELYNLQQDSSEKNNLAEKETKRREQLHDLLKSWRKTTKAPVPTEKNPKFQSN
jgi:arylsulfatase A-like enzyme